MARVIVRGRSDSRVLLLLALALVALPACGARTGLPIPAACSSCSPDDPTCVTAPCPGEVGVTGAVLFGGQGGDGLLDDTWAWDGAAWTARPVSGPSARSQAAMGVLDGKVVMFGGMGESNDPLDDTWEWDGAAWTRLPVTGPSARYAAKLAPLRGRLVLFGGYGAYLAQIQSDTWTWDGLVWEQIPAEGPAPLRGDFAMATLGPTVVLFSGERLPNGYLADTWTFDGAAWTERGSAGAPPGRSGGGLVALGGELVLYGGYDDGYATTPFEDTWTWSGAAWNALHIPGPGASNDGGRWSPAMGVVAGNAVLFGGGTFDGTPTYGDTWTFDGATWGQRNVSGPSPRAGAAMAAR